MKNKIFSTLFFTLSLTLSPLRAMDTSAPKNFDEPKDTRTLSDQEKALAILQNEQNGCAVESNGKYHFAFQGEIFVISRAIQRDPDIMETFKSNMEQIITNVQGFDIDRDFKDTFIRKGNQTICSIGNAQRYLSKRCCKPTKNKITTNALRVGKATYGLSNLYGLVGHLRQATTETEINEINSFIEMCLAMMAFESYYL